MKTFRVTSRQKQILQVFIDVSLLYPKFTSLKRMQMGAKHLGVAENGYIQACRKTIKSMGITEKELITGFQNTYILEVQECNVRQRNYFEDVYEEFKSGVSVDVLSEKYSKSIDRIQQIITREEAKFHKNERQKKLDMQIKNEENPSVVPTLAFSPDGNKSYQKRQT